MKFLKATNRKPFKSFKGADPMLIFAAVFMSLYKTLSRVGLWLNP
jgi:hypothetical protein